MPTKQYRQKVINFIIEEIFNRKLTKNAKIMSQNFLMIKLNVSRIVVINALNDLVKAGAIYSIPKKGYFVSEYFSNIIRPIEEEYAIDETIIEAQQFTTSPPWFETYHIKMAPQIKKYLVKYYRGRDLIIDSNLYISAELTNDYATKSNFIATLMQEKIKLKSILNKYYFENNQIINIKLYFGYHAILAARKSYIKAQEFELIKEEFNIY